MWNDGACAREEGARPVEVGLPCSVASPGCGQKMPHALTYAMGEP